MRGQVQSWRPIVVGKEPGFGPPARAETVIDGVTTPPFAGRLFAPALEPES
jgi:hypothetical protein